MAVDVDPNVIAVMPGMGPLAPILAATNKTLIANQAPALFVEHENMVKYKQRVDALLEQLKDSKADSDHFADGTVSQGAFGKGFAEAEGLYSAYNKVRSELQTLSKALAGQIEALGIAIMASKVGYENIDEDVKARMRAIHAAAQQEFEKHQKNHPNQHNQPNHQNQPNQPQGNGSTAGGEM
ncbi:hypothetical protein [Streptomyces antimicrobicus]|uniref:Uncharacterized protein n=1 Tax=Streptomyces antimicrobicus TaxID=2883108 RepID=A0ABS8BAZ0_9ACTN|nr:hypothetical protein [Streptomyces antimicrobicus]MCB5181780.1 hypothetical protein [Streptomyces antimicrobicus]